MPGVFQLAQQVDLAAEAPQRGAGQAAHDLQRDIPLRMRFARQIDAPHATFAKQAQDAVGTDFPRKRGIDLRLFVQCLRRVVLHPAPAFPVG